MYTYFITIMAARPLSKSEYITCTHIHVAANSNKPTGYSICTIVNGIRQHRINIIMVIWDIFGEVSGAVFTYIQTSGQSR